MHTDRYRYVHNGDNGALQRMRRRPQDKTFRYSGLSAGYVYVSGGRAGRRTRFYAGAPDGMGVKQLAGGCGPVSGVWRNHSHSDLAI